MLRLNHSIIILLAFSIPILDCRKSGGSSGGGRGISGSRTQGGGGFGGVPPQQYGGLGVNQPGGNKPGAGPASGAGYPPQQAGGAWGGSHQPQPNYGGSPPRGGSYGNGHYGNGPHGGFNQPPVNAGFGNNQKSNTARNALLGGLGGALIGGLATYGVMSALQRDHPIAVGGKDYYFDQQAFHAKPGEFMCSIPLEELVKPDIVATTTTTTIAPMADGTTVATPISPEKALSQATFTDGTRPKHVVWGCRQGSEVCCEGKCCPAQNNQQMYGNGGLSPKLGSGSSFISIALIVLARLLLCVPSGLQFLQIDLRMDFAKE